MTQNTATGYPTTASIISLIGGIIITLGGVLFVAVSAFILPSLNYGNLVIPQNLPASAIPGLVSGFVGMIGIFGLVSGAIVLVSSVMLLTGKGQPRTWSVLILVFSILSLFGLGGFLVGAVLGIVGGALALRWKPQTV
jgi:hypothetical protein